MSTADGRGGPGSNQHATKPPQAPREPAGSHDNVALAHALDVDPFDLEAASPAGSAQRVADVAARSMGQRVAKARTNLDRTVAQTEKSSALAVRAGEDYLVQRRTEGLVEDAVEQRLYDELVEKTSPNTAGRIVNEVVHGDVTRPLPHTVRNAAVAEGVDEGQADYVAGAVRLHLTQLNQARDRSQASSDEWHQTRSNVVDDVTTAASLEQTYDRTVREAGDEVRSRLVDDGWPDGITDDIVRNTVNTADADISELRLRRTKAARNYEAVCRTLGTNPGY